MSKIDDRILETLNSEDRELMQTYTAQPGFLGMLLEPMRGSFGPSAIAAFGIMIVVFVTLVFSIFQFFPEQDVLRKLNWMAIALAMLIFLGFLRLWFFQEISRLSILRELKRLELQLSLQARKSG
jgi:hypothetical protein